MLFRSQRVADDLADLIRVAEVVRAATDDAGLVDWSNSISLASIDGRGVLVDRAGATRGLDALPELAQLRDALAGPVDALLRSRVSGDEAAVMARGPALRKGYVLTGSVHRV